MKNMLIIAITILAGFAIAGQVAAQTPVSGHITSNTTWSSDVLLQGPVFVDAGVTLTVNPGVTIYSEKASIGALIISRGGKINAVGTPDNPIVLTSDQLVPFRGDVGGMIINGYAPINVTGGTKIGEGQGDDFSRTFGCTGMTCPDPATNPEVDELSDCTFSGVSDCNVADNSGTLQYFRTEYGGLKFTATNEYNGIALQGVGNGTTLDHIQAYFAADDGIEFFGGSVNIKYAIVTAEGDDIFDWTDGWTGSAQFVVGQQRGDDCDNGIEADNWEFGYNAHPRSKPVVYNATWVGDATWPATKSNDGMRIRRGTGGNIRNGIVMNFKNQGLDIDDPETYAQITDGDLIIDNNIILSAATPLGNLGGMYDASSVVPMSVFTNNLDFDPELESPTDLVNPDLRPKAGSPAVDGTVPVAAPPTGNTFVVATDFIGALDYKGEDWTRQPWTTFGRASWTGSCAADIMPEHKGDCFVDVDDLAQMKSEFNRIDCSPANPCWGDISGPGGAFDAKVNLTDLVQMKRDYLKVQSDCCPWL
jgi:hypothetical protein